MLDIRVAAKASDPSEIRHSAHGGASHNARRLIRDLVTNVPTLTSPNALRVADALVDPIFDDSILEGPGVRRDAPWF